MAITEVRQTVLSSEVLGSSPTTFIQTVTTTAGNLLVFTFGNESAALNIAITSITDDTGNIWVQVPNALAYDPDVDISTDIWYAKNCVGGEATLTVSFSGGPELQSSLIITEFSGVHQTSPLVTGSGANLVVPASSPSPSVSPDMTPDRTGELLVTVICPSGFPSFVLTGVDSPWTGYVDSTYSALSAVAYLINPALSTTHATFQPTTSTYYVSSAAIFQPPASSGPSAKQKASSNLIF